MEYELLFIRYLNKQNYHVDGRLIVSYDLKLTLHFLGFGELFSDVSRNILLE